MKTHLWIIAGALALGTVAACATITAPPTPESARITVPLTTSVEDAVARTEAAFVAEGLSVASANGGVVVSVPIDLAPGVPVTYRAVVVPDSNRADVVFTGTVHNDQGAAMAAYMTGMRMDAGDQPLHSAMKGKLGEAWARLERIADRVRGS